MGTEIHNSAWKDLFSGNANQIAAGLSSLLQGRATADLGFKNQTQADSLSLTQISQQHEINRLQIEGNHALDGHLQAKKRSPPSSKRNSRSMLKTSVTPASVAPLCR